MIGSIEVEDRGGKTWIADKGNRNEVVFLAMDSTGLKPTTRGDWMGEKWNVRRGHIKVHVVVDSETKKIYAVSITDDTKGDAPEFARLLDEAIRALPKGLKKRSS